MGKREFKETFHKYYPELCIYANRIFNDLDLSKDVVQDVFIKVWEDQITFESTTHAQKYLYVMVKNNSLNIIKSAYYRKSSKFNQYSSELRGYDPFIENELEEEKNLKLTVLKRAIKKLTPLKIKIIRLILDGVDNKYIGNELNITVNTVKDHRKVIFNKIRTEFSNSGLLP